MIVGLRYLDFTLAFLLQHKLLVFVAFFGEYGLMHIRMYIFIHGLCPPVIWIDMIDWFRCGYMVFLR